jgi:hypothetical protein
VVETHAVIEHELVLNAVIKELARHEELFSAAGHRKRG